MKYQLKPPMLPEGKAKNMSSLIEEDFGQIQETVGAANYGSKEVEIVAPEARPGLELSE
jgi:hypothetical protein